MELRAQRATLKLIQGTAFIGAQLTDLKIWLIRICYMTLTEGIINMIPFGRTLQKNMNSNPEEPCP
jgi:hypothetical protein